MNTIQNLWTAIQVEWLKIHRLWLVPLAILLGIFLPCFYFYLVIKNESIPVDMNDFQMSSIEYFYGTLVAPFGSFMLLTFIIIAVLRMTQIEHKNHGWGWMESKPLSRFSIYFGKYLVCLFLNGICIVSFFIGAIIVAQVSQHYYPERILDMSIPYGYLIHQFIRLWTLTMGVTSLQLMVSTLSSGFLLPILVGFIGMVRNNVAMIYQSYKDWIPYDMYGLGTTLKDVQTLNHYFNYTEWLSILYAIAIAVIGYQFYRFREIKSYLFRSKKRILLLIATLVTMLGLYWWVTMPIQSTRLPNATRIEGSIESNIPIDTIRIISPKWDYEIAKIPVKNGQFRWETPEDIPLNEYQIQFANHHYDFVFSKGDDIRLFIQKDSARYRVTEKGSRKAESYNLAGHGGVSANLLRWRVDWSDYQNNANKFLEDLTEDVEDIQKYWEDFRTPDNYYLAEDYRRYKIQTDAIRLLNIIEEYRQKHQKDKSKDKEINAIEARLLSLLEPKDRIFGESEGYLEWTLKKYQYNKMMDSVDIGTLQAIHLLPSSKEKNNLMAFLLLKSMENTTDTAQRNKLWADYHGDISDKHILSYVEQHLANLNRQSRGISFPKFDYEDMFGNAKNLSEFKGKYIIIDFWATWCGPCTQIKPFYEEQAEDYQYREDMVFLSMSIDQDIEAWRKDVRNNKSNVTQWRIKTPNALKIMGFRGIPHFMLVGKDGKIYYMDMPRPNEPKFEKILNNLKEK